MATLIPGVIAGPSGRGVAPPDTSGIVQLALAIKQIKTQQEEQKKQEAAQRVQTVLSNPTLLQMMDPKSVEADLKTLGFKLADVTGGAPPELRNLPLNVRTQDLSALGAATQGSQAGAAAAAPPSPQAARRAPGAGVTGSAMSPGSGQLDQMVADARARYGALAPLYLQARTQQERALAEAQNEIELQHLRSAADAGDLRAMGRLMIRGGYQITDADMRAMIISSNIDTSTPGGREVWSQALDFALGNETPMDRARRETDTLKALAGSPEFMQRLQNPADIGKVAHSITEGGGLPADVPMRAKSLDQITQEAKLFQAYVEDVGLPADLAMHLAESKAAGADVTLSLPKGFQTLAQIKARATLTGAQAELARVGLEQERVGLDIKKIQLEIAEHDPDLEMFKSLVDMQKAKGKIPPEIMEAAMGKIAQKAGLSVERVNNVFHFLTGGTHLEYKGLPAEGVAAAAAGTPQQGTRAAAQGTDPNLVREITGGLRRFGQRGGLPGSIQEYYRWYYGKALPRAGAELERFERAYYEALRDIVGSPTQGEAQ